MMSMGYRNNGSRLLGADCHSFLGAGGVAFSELILRHSVCAMSVVNLFESSTIADHARTADGGKRLDALVDSLGLAIQPATTIARRAYRSFGKGSHPARLNLGDCFAYALAKSRSEPLLFKGGDFALTDVEIAHE
jgi:ribonuclease VapC